MISKPPELGDDKPEIWIQKFLGYFQRVRFEFMKTEGLWIPAQSNDVHGNHPGELLVALGSAYISVVLPRGIKEVKEAVIRIIPTTTGTLDWTANSSYGGVDEDESANTSTKTADGLSVTDDRIMEIDVTSLFDAFDADDQLGIQFTVDALTTTTNIYVLGLYLKYR